MDLATMFPQRATVAEILLSQVCLLYVLAPARANVRIDQASFFVHVRALPLTYRTNTNEENKSITPNPKGTVDRVSMGQAKTFRLLLRLRGWSGQLLVLTHELTSCPRL